MIFHDLSQNIVQAVELLIRGRLPEEKNPEKVGSFATPGGGGSWRVEKSQTSIMEKS